MSETNILYQIDIEGALSFKKKPFIIATEYISHGDRKFMMNDIEGVITKVTSNTSAIDDLRPTCSRPAQSNSAAIRACCASAS